VTEVRPWWPPLLPELYLGAWLRRPGSWRQGAYSSSMPLSWRHRAVRGRERIVSVSSTGVRQSRLSREAPGELCSNRLTSMACRLQVKHRSDLPGSDAMSLWSTPTSFSPRILLWEKLNRRSKAHDLLLWAAAGASHRPLTPTKHRPSPPPMPPPPKYVPSSPRKRFLAQGLGGIDLVFCWLFSL
jgi:hypothetical protein